MGYWRAESNREAGSVFFCSECGGRVHMVVGGQVHGRPVVYTYPYCPWCQSEMNGGVIKSAKMSPCDECACIGNSFCCIENGKPNPEKCMLINGGSHEETNV